MIRTITPSIQPSAAYGFGRITYGNKSSTTVMRYAMPVYEQDLSASLRPSLLADKNSLDAIEKVAEIPTIRPERTTRRVLARAKVKPAMLPASSTSASLRPSTILPT